MSDSTERSRARTEHASEIMSGFARRSGLTSDAPQQRYLWTDAFAVCNFLALARRTGDAHQLELAVQLIDRVHATLGRHRDDETRVGWLSGLDEPEGAAHPTRGGLRIGKKLPERRIDQSFDEQLEWERDGQYFHYLTRWMHALDLTARATQEPRLNRWARELAAAAYEAFSYLSPGTGQRRMVWKMSIDLSRPLVASMGQHDALDGLITCAQLQDTAARLAAAGDGPDLDEELAAFASMADASELATADPLGIGGMLMDACRLQQLSGRVVRPDAALVPALLAAAHTGLDHYARQGELHQPASRRLAFRELGLAIGLRAVSLMRAQLEAGDVSGPRPRELSARLDALLPFVRLRPLIDAFWLEPEHQRADSWATHRDINEVMLAASLVPEGCLVLGPEHQVASNDDAHA